MNTRPWSFSILFLVLLSFNHHATGVRIFYIIGNMANDLPQVEDFMAKGANGVAVDVQFSLDGRPTRTSHGFPCSCFRNCFTSDIFKHVLEHLRQVTTPEISGTADVKLSLIFLNLRVQFIGGGALYTAGKRLGEALLMHYFDGGLSGVTGWVVLSVPTMRHALLFKGVKDVFQEFDATHILDQIGFDIGSNEPFQAIYETFVSLDINEHLWVGDGVSNCLIRSTDRLEVLLDERDTGEARFSRVYHWTIDSPPNLRMSLRLGVDAIITNRPDRLLTVLEEDEFYGKYRLATPEDRPWSRVIQGSVTLPSSSIDFDTPSAAVFPPGSITINNPGEADINPGSSNSDKDCTKSSTLLDDDPSGFRLELATEDTTTETSITTIESSSDISETKDLTDDDVSSKDISTLVDLLKGRSAEGHHPSKKSVFQSEDIADAIRKIADRSSTSNSESDGELTKVLIELLRNVNTPAPSSSVPVDTLMALMALQAPPPSPSVPLELATYLLRPPQPNPTTQLLDLLRPSYGSSSVPIDTLRVLLELQSRSPQTSLPLSLLQPSTNFGGNSAFMSLLLSSLQSKSNSQSLNSLLPLLLSSKLGSADLAKVLSALTSSNKDSKLTSQEDSKTKSTPTSPKGKQQTGRELDDTKPTEKDSSKSSTDNTKQALSKPKGRDANCNRNLTKNFPLPSEFNPSFHRPFQPLSTMVMADIGPDGVYWRVIEKPAHIQPGIGPVPGSPFFPPDLLKTPASQTTKDKQNKDTAFKLLSSGFVPNDMPIQVPLTPFGRPPFPGNRPLPFRRPRLPPIRFNRPFRPGFPPRHMMRPPRPQPFLIPCPYPGSVGCGPNTHSHASPNYGPVTDIINYPGPVTDIIKYPTGKGIPQSYYSYRTKGLTGSTHDHRTLPPIHTGSLYKPPVYTDSESGHSHDFKSTATGGAHSVKTSSNSATKFTLPNLKDSAHGDANDTLNLNDEPFVTSAVKDSSAEIKINQAGTIDDIMDLLKSPTTTVATPTNDPDEPVIPTLEQLNDKENLASILDRLTSSTAKSTEGTTHSAKNEDNLTGSSDIATESPLNKDQEKLALLPQDEFFSSLLPKPESLTLSNDDGSEAKSTTEFPPFSLDDFESTLTPVHSDLAAHLAILSGKWPVEISVTGRPGTTTGAPPVIEIPISTDEGVANLFHSLETTPSTQDKNVDNGGRVDSSFPGRNETLLPPTGGLGWNGNGVDLTKLQQLLSEHTGKRMEVIIIENTPLIFVPSSVPGMRAQQLAKLSELAGTASLGSTTPPPFDEFDQHTSTTKKRAATLSPLEVNDLDITSENKHTSIPSSVTEKNPAETGELLQVPVDFTISKPSQGLSHLLLHQNPTASLPKEEESEEIVPEVFSKPITNNDQNQKPMLEQDIEIILPESFGLRLNNSALGKHIPNHSSAHQLFAENIHSQDEDDRRKEPVQQVVKPELTEELEHDISNDHVQKLTTDTPFPFLVQDSEELMMAETTQMPMVNTQRRPLTYTAVHNQSRLPTVLPHHASNNRHKGRPLTVNKHTSFQTESIRNPTAAFHTITKHSSNSSFVSIIQRGNFSSHSSKHDSKRDPNKDVLPLAVHGKTESNNLTASFVEHSVPDEGSHDFSDHVMEQFTEDSVKSQHLMLNPTKPFGRPLQNMNSAVHNVGVMHTSTESQQTHQNILQSSLGKPDSQSSMDTLQEQKSKPLISVVVSALNDEDFFIKQGEKLPSTETVQTHQHRQKTSLDNLHFHTSLEKPHTQNLESSVEESRENGEDVLKHESEKLTTTQSIESNQNTQQSSFDFQNSMGKQQKHKLDPLKSVEESINENDFINPDSEKVLSTQSLQTDQQQKQISAEKPHFHTSVHTPQKEISAILKSVNNSTRNGEHFLNHEVEKTPSKSMQTQHRQQISPGNIRLHSSVDKPQKETLETPKPVEESTLNGEHFLNHEVEKTPSKSVQTQNQQQISPENTQLHSTVDKPQKETLKTQNSVEESTLNGEHFLNHEVEKTPSKSVQTQHQQQISPENIQFHSNVDKPQKDALETPISVEESTLNREHFLNHEVGKMPSKSMQTQHQQQILPENIQFHSSVDKPQKNALETPISVEESTLNGKHFLNHEVGKMPSKSVQTKHQQQISPENIQFHSSVDKPQKNALKIPISVEETTLNGEHFLNHEVGKMPSKSVQTQHQQQISPENIQFHSSVDKPQKDALETPISVEESTLNGEHFLNHEVGKTPSKSMQTQHQQQISPENIQFHSSVDMPQKDALETPISVEESTLNGEHFLNHEVGKMPSKSVQTQHQQQISPENIQFHSSMDKPQKDALETPISVEESTLNGEHFLYHEVGKMSSKSVQTQHQQQILPENIQFHSSVDKPQNDALETPISVEESTLNGEHFLNHEVGKTPSKSMQPQHQQQISPENIQFHSSVDMPQNDALETPISVEESTLNREHFLNHEVGKMPSKSVQTQHQQQISPENIQFHSSVDKPQKDALETPKSVEESTLNREHFLSHEVEKTPSKSVQTETQQQISPEHTQLHSSVDKPQKGTLETLKDSPVNEEDLLKHAAEGLTQNKNEQPQLQYQNSPELPTFHRSPDILQKDKIEHLKSLMEMSVNKDDLLKFDSEKTIASKSPHTRQNQQHSSVQTPDIHVNTKKPQENFELPKSQELSAVNTQHTLKTTAHEMSREFPSSAVVQNSEGISSSFVETFLQDNVDDSQETFPRLKPVDEYTVDVKDLFVSKKPLDEDKKLSQIEMGEVRINLESSLDGPKFTTGWNEAAQHQIKPSEPVDELLFKDDGMIVPQNLPASNVNMPTDGSIHVTQDNLDSTGSLKFYYDINEAPKETHGLLHLMENEGLVTTMQGSEKSSTFSSFASFHSQNPKSINTQQQKEHSNPFSSVAESPMATDSSLTSVTNYELHNAEAFSVYPDNQSSLREPELHTSLDEPQVNVFVPLNPITAAQVNTKTVLTAGNLPESDKNSVLSSQYIQHIVLLSSDNSISQTDKLLSRSSFSIQEHTSAVAGYTFGTHVEEHDVHIYSPVSEISDPNPHHGVLADDPGNDDTRLNIAAKVEKFDAEKFGMKLQLGKRPSTNFSILLESFTNNSLPVQNKPVFTSEFSPIHTISAATQTNLHNPLPETNTLKHYISSTLNVKPEYDSIDELNMELRNFGPSPALSSTPANTFSEVTSITKATFGTFEVTLDANNNANDSHVKNADQTEMYIEPIETPLDSSFLSQHFTTIHDDKSIKQISILEATYKPGKEIMFSSDSLLLADLQTPSIHRELTDSPLSLKPNSLWVNNAAMLHDPTIINPLDTNYTSPQVIDIATTQSNNNKAAIDPSKTLTSETVFQHQSSLGVEETWAQQTLSVITEENSSSKAKFKTDGKHTADQNPKLLNADELSNTDIGNQNNKWEDISSFHKPSIMPILDKKQVLITDCPCVSTTDLANSHNSNTFKSLLINEMPLKDTLLKDDPNGYQLESELYSSPPLTEMTSNTDLNNVRMLLEQTGSIPNLLMSTIQVLKAFDESQQSPLHQDKFDSEDIIHDVKEPNLSSNSESDNAPKMHKEEHHQTAIFSEAGFLATSTDISTHHSASQPHHHVDSINSATANCSHSVQNYPATNLGTAFQNYPATNLGTAFQNLLYQESLSNNEDEQTNLPSSQFHHSPETFKLPTRQPKPRLTLPEPETSILQTHQALPFTLQVTRSGESQISDKVNLALMNTDKGSFAQTQFNSEQLLSSYIEKEVTKPTVGVNQDVVSTSNITLQQAAVLNTTTREPSPTENSLQLQRNHNHSNLDANHPTQLSPPVGTSVRKQRPHVVSLRVPVPRPPVPTLRRPAVQSTRTSNNKAKTSPITSSNKFPTVLRTRTPHVSVQHKGSATAPPPKPSNMHNESKIYPLSTNFKSQPSANGQRSTSAAQRQFLQNITRLSQYTQAPAHEAISAPVLYPNKPHTIVTIQPAIHPDFSIHHAKNGSVGSPLYQAKDGSVSIINIPGPLQQPGFSITVKNVHETRDSDHHGSRHEKVVTAQTLEIERRRKDAQRRMDTVAAQEPHKSPGESYASDPSPVHGPPRQSTPALKSVNSPQPKQYQISPGRIRSSDPNPVRGTGRQSTAAQRSVHAPQAEQSQKSPGRIRFSNPSPIHGSPLQSTTAPRRVHSPQATQLQKSPGRIRSSDSSLVHGPPRQSTSAQRSVHSPQAEQYQKSPERIRSSDSSLVNGPPRQSTSAQRHVHSPQAEQSQKSPGRIHSSDPSPVRGQSTAAQSSVHAPQADRSRKSPERIRSSDPSPVRGQSTAAQSSVHAPQADRSRKSPERIRSSDPSPVHGPPHQSTTAQRRIHSPQAEQPQKSPGRMRSSYPSPVHGQPTAAQRSVHAPQVEQSQKSPGRIRSSDPNPIHGSRHQHATPHRTFHSPKVNSQFHPLVTTQRQRVALQSSDFTRHQPRASVSSVSHKKASKVASVDLHQGVRVGFEKHMTSRTALGDANISVMHRPGAYSQPVSASIAKRTLPVSSDSQNRYTNWKQWSSRPGYMRSETANDTRRP